MTIEDQTLQDEAIAAMDKGIAAVSESQPEAANTPEPLETEPAEDSVPESPEDPPETETPAEPEAEGEAPAVPEPEADTLDAEVEDEITALGIDKDKTKARFRELSAAAKAAEPIKAELEKAGVDLAQLPQVLKQAESHREWVKYVVDTGATPEQYGMTLDYLRDIGSAAGGDLQAAERAFDKVMGEARSLAKLLGKEIPGVHDPLAEYPDLADKVDGMELDRGMALEIARARDIAAATSQAQASRAEHAAASGVQDQAFEQLQQLHQHYTANDPDYQRKYPILQGIVQRIQQTLPPNVWAQATQDAYVAIQLPAVAAATPPPAARPRVSAMPIRPQGNGQRMRPATFEDPMAAMEYGLSHPEAAAR